MNPQDVTSNFEIDLSVRLVPVAQRHQPGPLISIFWRETVSDNLVPGGRAGLVYHFNALLKVAVHPPIFQMSSNRALDTLVSIVNDLHLSKITSGWFEFIGPFIHEF